MGDVFIFCKFKYIINYDCTYIIYASIELTKYTILVIPTIYNII